MRLGMNPLRLQQVTEPDKVAAVITHLPNQEGYHAQRFEVLKTCLLSMRLGAPGIPVTVWDNGSCHEMIDWLQNEYKPETLILSANIGKSNARAALYHMVNPETIMSLSDDDMLFYPGWWDESEKLLKHFPNVGKISCYPVRTQARWGSTLTREWAKKNGKVRTGKIISEDEDYDFCTSIGRDYNFQKEFTEAEFDTVVKYNGVEAYCFAHHCQFMAYSGVIAPFCKRSDDCMADEKPFDSSVDYAGLLQFTTLQRYARHIGNIVDPKVSKEFESMKKEG
jgi:hypothetical protein